MLECDLHTHRGAHVCTRTVTSSAAQTADNRFVLFFDCVGDVISDSNRV